MLGTARHEGAGKLDAIVYRAGARRAFYVSEHATSLARGRDLLSCIDNLSLQVREDVEAGVYPPEDREITHTFVTSVEVPLELRDSRRMQLFVCRVDETVDARGRVRFDSQCPTNYLTESGRSIADAAGKLKDVIAARYEGESVTDLMRELPKRPMMTSFSLRKARHVRQVSAVIRPSPDGFEAYTPEAPVKAKGSDPFVALRNLEAALGDIDLSQAPVLKGEPVYCTLDVPLHLKENTVTHRFFATISRYNGTSTPFFAAHVPQCGISLSGRTFDEALNAAGDAIALEYREKSAHDVSETLKKPLMLTAAYVMHN